MAENPTMGQALRSVFNRIGSGMDAMERDLLAAEHRAATAEAEVARLAAELERLRGLLAEARPSVRFQLAQNGKLDVGGEFLARIDAALSETEVERG